MKLMSLLCTALVLASCDDRHDEPADTPGDVVPVPATALTRGDEPAPVGDDCGSLTPLLAMLPTEMTLGGLPRTFRGCELEGHRVSAIYTDGGADPTELRFDVEVIDGNSRLLDSAFPQDLTPEERRKVGDAASAPGEMSRLRLDQCRRYDANPVIPGRNPRIVRTAGMDVCVMDTIDADKAHWFTFTFLPHLRVEIELTGPGAGRLATTTAAAEYLMPLFRRFALDAAPPRLSRPDRRGPVATMSAAAGRVTRRRPGRPAAPWPRQVTRPAARGATASLAQALRLVANRAFPDIPVPVEIATPRPT